MPTPAADFVTWFRFAIVFRFTMTSGWTMRSFTSCSTSLPPPAKTAVWPAFRAWAERLDASCGDRAFELENVFMRALPESCRG